MGIMNGRIQGTNRIYFEADSFRGIDIKKGIVRALFVLWGQPPALAGSCP